ncbi:MAG: MFS transporter [Cytophagales bacterium]|nr:MAG: MFS transporter [Cytophagales bacterium]TAF60857.1 MAG: MFS transporter [Cytophagales bacterium]
MTVAKPLSNPNLLNTAVIIAALGYFVDIYDLVLFSIVRVQSLKSLGFSGEELTSKGILLIDMQMLGMLVGGILWGVLGDKKGRLSVLFGSILTYSLANIANGFVDNITSYAVWRFIAGIGLAGELGAGITLVAEVLPKEKRGYGTMIVAVIGLLGAVVAGFLHNYFDWRVCYFVGGGLGLSLLLLRIGMAESGMFAETQEKGVARGNFFALFTKKSRLIKYLRCIFIGLTTWYVIGILVTFSPEFAKSMGVVGEVSAGTAIMFAYGGLVVGDLLSGLLSQILKSRIKVMFIFLTANIVAVSFFLSASGVTANTLYWLCGFLGVAAGFWVIFVTIAAEQFGTNLRATVTTTVPNFVRGALVPLTVLFQWLNSSYGVLNAAIYVGLFTIVVAFISLWGLKETFHEDLNYQED